MAVLYDLLRGRRRRRERREPGRLMAPGSSGADARDRARARRARAGPGEGLDARVDVLVRDGEIAALGDALDAPAEPR